MPTPKIYSSKGRALPKHAARRISLSAAPKISHCKAIYHTFLRNVYHIPQEYIMAAAKSVRLPIGAMIHTTVNAAALFLKAMPSIHTMPEKPKWHRK